MRLTMLFLAAFGLTLFAGSAKAGCRTAGHHFGGGYGASYGVGANFAFTPSYSYGASVSLVPQYSPPVVSLALPSYSAPLAVAGCADYAAPALLAPLVVPTYSYAPSFAFFGTSYGFHGGFHGRHR